MVLRLFVHYRASVCIQETVEHPKRIRQRVMRMVLLLALVFSTSHDGTGRARRERKLPARAGQANYEL